MVLVNMDNVERIVELVLGCAVLCEERAFYVGQIMQFDEDIQKSLMTTIQTLLDNGPTQGTGACLLGISIC